MAEPSGGTVAKQYPRSAQTGRQGVALIDSIVSDMGHIWREKTTTDVGIDGEIELVDQVTRAALGRLLLVQSKARSGDFENEDDRSFRFRCSANDLEYWLSASAPVLLVCSRPATKEAWFKNVTTWFQSDPDRRRGRVIEFDKASDVFDVSVAPALIDLGVPVSTGIYLRPPPRPETLTSNLLRVEHMASSVHLAPTSVRGWKEINDRLRAAGHKPVDDVVWREKVIYSFRPFDEAPLDVLADDSPERVGTEELATSKSDDDRRLLVRLLNNTLRELRGELRWSRDRGYLYFPATEDLQPRKVKIGSGGSGRTVFQRYLDKETQSRVVYYRHYALRFQFVHLDEGWFLTLSPTYHFTRDGFAESKYAGELLKGIKKLEGHSAIAKLTSFWARYLRSRHDLFSTPDQRLRFGLLAEVDLEHGIDDAYWKPRDKVAVIDVTEPDDPINLADQGTLEGFL